METKAYVSDRDSHKGDHHHLILFNVIRCQGNVLGTNYNITGDDGDTSVTCVRQLACHGVGDGDKGLRA